MYMYMKYSFSASTDAYPISTGMYLKISIYTGLRLQLSGSAQSVQNATSSSFNTG